MAGWATKRRWVQEAFEALEAAGYHVGSAYTAVKDKATTKFLYRDRLWQGADLVGLGVASFGHVSGVHMQNLDTWEAYCGRDRPRRDSAEPRVPADRRGADDSRVHPAAQARVDPAGVLPARSTASTCSNGSPSRSRRSAPTAFSTPATADAVSLTRAGLLRVDALLPRFFLPQHVGRRYT